jgi:glycosyltransferase involved in cell wall biosynthesis
MKILMFFYDLSGAAGIQRVITTLAGALVSRGIEVHVVVTSPDTRCFFGLDGRVRVHSIGAPEPHSEHRLVRWTSKARWAASTLSRLCRYVADHGITHVIDHGTALGMLYPFRTLGRAHFVLFRHFPVNAFPHGRTVYKAIRPLKSRAHVVVLTSSIRAELDALGYRNVEVIPNPLLRVGSLSAPAQKEPVILAVGRDNPQKGFDLLVHAFRSLLQSHPEVMLRVVGAGVSTSPTLTPLIEMLGIRARVTLQEPVSDLASAIDSSSVVALPSRYEALPMFMLEALSRGAAVVGTDVDGIRDFIRNGENGVLVRAESADALAAGIRSVLDDASLAERISRKAPESVAHLSPEKVADAWITYLDALR